MLAPTCEAPQRLSALRQPFDQREAYRASASPIVRTWCYEHRDDLDLETAMEAYAQWLEDEAPSVPSEEGS